MKAETVGVETKEEILRAAERLFASQGIAESSLRRITREAGVNLAAVHYHFGSKEALVRAVLERRLAPLNRVRLDRLEELGRRGDRAPELEEVIRAFVGPVFEMIDREQGGHAFARFVVRTFSEPDEELRQDLLGQFSEVIRRFVDALSEQLPHLSQEEIYWRFHFMVGSMTHTAGMGTLAQRFSGGLCDPMDVEGVIDRLVAYISGGLRAPSCRDAK